MERKIRIVIPLNQCRIGLTIDISNEYLIKVATLNWGEDLSPAERELNLSVLPDEQCEYTVIRLGKDKWQCKGVYHYSALKIAIRGVLSDAAIEDVMFVHGCSFQLKMTDTQRGIILVGASGAGKTTLISNLVNRDNISFRVINDDWGAYIISKKIAVSTGEHYLHMKLKSAQAINPDFRDESMFMPENYRDGIRGLIRLSDVYPYKTRETVVDTWVILLHDIDYPHYYRSICADEAVDIITKGSYSPFYNQNERFMNGSLILDSEEAVTFHRKLLYHALQGERIVLINNTGSPFDLSNNFMNAMEVL